jgi:DNA-binding NtrC family response regulator
MGDQLLRGPDMNTPPTATSQLAANNSGLRLVIVGDERFQTFPLPNDGQVTIGRTLDNDICIEDSSVSRQHAVLELGAAPCLKDLGSRNGTRVGDRWLAPNIATPIPPHQSFFIGNVMAVLERLTIGPRPRRLWPHGYFEGRVEEECARADRNRSCFAVLRLRCAPTVSEQDAIGVIADTARASDMLAKYGPGDYEVLLLDLKAPQIDEIAYRFRDRLSAIGIIAEVRWAVFPVDGRSADLLIARAGFGGDPRSDGAGSISPPTSEGMARLEHMLERVAGSEISVLIMGETGVGKDVLAERLHRLSHRAPKPFLRLNCAAFSETLLESELFGHERGAFTGAERAKPGLLETAQGGTVLFDEVGELPPSLQAKLLRVLEERKVLRVGGLEPRPIDVRFVSATNRNLEEASAAGLFRQDLFFRLNGVSLVIPPLRERKGEIEPLAHQFIEHACRTQARLPLVVDPIAMELLKQYSWPGNIRELRNVMERAVVLSTGDSILMEHLPHEKMLATVAQVPRPPSSPPHTLLSDESTERMVQLPELPLTPPEGGKISASALGVWQQAREAERGAIMEALAQCGGNQTRAAKLLKISRRTLVNRLDKYGIARPKKG